MKKVEYDIDAMDEAEFDRLVRHIRFDFGVFKAERKKIRRLIRERDEKRVVAGMMSLEDYSRRWPLDTQVRTPEDLAKMKRNRAAG
jgi:hypothetical protein